MRKSDEDRLVEMLLNPNHQREAFSLMVNMYSEQLYWKIRHMVLSHDDANDVLQNTFIKAWKKLSTFQNRSRFSTWLYRIAINESLDFIRHNRLMQKISADEDMSIAAKLMADEYFDGDKAMALLQEAISTLPEVQRTVFNLRYYDQMKYSEISLMLDTTEGALKASYHLAVKKIKKYIEKKE